MKKLSIIMTFVALFAMTSCDSLSNIATNPTAAASGAACGKALVALRASKKAGTLSITNPTDLSNILVVASSYKTLKNNKGDANFKKSFATGMVTGGNGVITNKNSTSIMNLLLGQNALGNVTNNSLITDGAQATSSIISILNALN